MVLERLTATYSDFLRGRLVTPVMVFTDGGVHRVLFGIPLQGAAALVQALHHP
jgi:hypothetical protein